MAMNELQEGLDAILEEKQEFLKPQNIKAGVEVLGVEGAIVDGGIDTTDADAVAEDLAFGKTAYVNGEKITGTNEYSDIPRYNIEINNGVPESRDVIWAKYLGDYEGVEFLYNQEMAGNALPNSNFTFLNTNTNEIGQEIYNSCMYVFGTTQAQSYKFDLNTKERYSINVPNVSVRSGFGACLYKEKIYIFWENGNLYYYIYDPNTNTSSPVVNTGFYASYYSDRGETGNVTLYNGVAYMQTCYSASDYGGSSIIRFNLESHSVDKVSGGCQRPGRCSTGYGRYKYIMYDGRTLYRFDCVTSSNIQFKAFTSAQLDSYCLPYCVDDDVILLFPTGTKNYYYKYIISEDSLKRISIDYTYYIFDTFGTWSKIPTSFDWFKLDKLTGILYIRTQSSYGSGYYGATGAIQLFVPTDYSQYPDGTLFATVSPEAEFIKIQSDNNLYTGIDNFYKLNNGTLTNQFMVCYGDGVDFKVLQNPTKETYTVTFDTAGGSEMLPLQVVCGEPIPNMTPPTKYHYLFNEWYYNGEPLDRKKRFVLDMTLTATWNDAYIVTYDYDDGSTYYEDTVLPNAKTTKPSVDPVKDWKEFLGWSLNGEPFDFNTPITEDITLSPIWGTVEEVDYIYSTGTQYIDTDIKPTGNTTVELDCRIKSSVATSEYTPIFGIRDTASSPTAQYCAYFLTANTRRLHYPHGSVSPTADVDSQYDLEDRNTLRCTPTQMYLNDELILEVPQSTFTTRYSMLLFALGSWSGTGDRSIDARKPATTLYNCKVYEGETLIAEFIPARAYDGKYILYDRVRKKIYRNIGTKNFYGPNKSYEEVDYLQTSGTQYINTGVQINNTTDMEVDYEFLRTSDYSAQWVPVIGYQSSSSSNKLAFWFNSSSRTASINYYSSDSAGSGSPTLTGRHLLRNIDNKFYIDGSLVYTASTGSFTGDKDICFFNVNCNGNFGNLRGGWARIYEVKLYGYNNVVFRDYIPAVDENNRPCYYDKITGEYLYNAGSGEFILPADESDYTVIPYLQTTGNQYFNLGANVSSSLKLEMKYNAIDYFKDGYGIIFGGRDGYTSNAFMLFVTASNPYNFPWFYRTVNVYQTLENYYWNKDVTVTASNGIVTLNDGENAETISLTGQSTFSGSTKLTIFNGQGSTSELIEEKGCITGKIYYIKMYINNILSADLIPVKDKNGIVCLYDKVSNCFLYHKGRGALLDHDVTFGSADYIDTYGNQYINTGITPTNTTKIEIKSRLFKDSKFDASLIGAKNTSTTKNRMGIFFSGNQGDVNYISYMGDTGNINHSRSLRYETDYKFVLDSTGCYINDEKVDNINAGTFTASENLCLFGLNENGNIDVRRFIGRTYYCKIWKDDVLVRDYIPKIDPSGDTVMYDNVSNKYYYPYGGGICTSGLPNGYTQVPYLQNIKKDCVINSGIKPNQDTRILASVEVMNWYSWTGLFGNWSDGNRKQMFSFDNGNQFKRFTFGYGDSYQSVDVSTTSIIGPRRIDMNRNVFKVDTASTTFSTKTFQNPYPITIFAPSSDTLAASSYEDMRLFAFTIYDSGFIARNYIPCYRNSDGRTGLYDVANNEFYYSYRYSANGYEFYYGNDDYEELVYLEGDGTQYIDTGFKPNQNTKLGMNIYGTENKGYWFGAWNVDYNNGAYSVVNDGGNVYFGYGNQYSNSGSALSNAFHYIQLNNNELYIDGSSFRTHTANNFQLNYNLYLYAQNRKGTYFSHINSPCTVRLSSVRLVDNNNQVKKYFIPSIRKSDKKPGMLDVINNVFHTNAGIGEFKYLETGKPLQEYEEVEYIQASGSQYIDTGFKPNQDTKVVLEVSNCVSNSGRLDWIFGSRSGSSVADRFSLVNNLDCVIGSDYGLDRQLFSSDLKLMKKTLIVKDRESTTIGDVTLTSPSATFTGAYNMTIFALNDNGSVSGYYVGMRLHSFKLYDNDILIRDYQPIKILATQEYALLDKVSGAIYRNVGSGKFIGENYMPTRVDYIQGSGYQYINTGITMSNDVEMECDYSMTNTPGSEYPIIGARNSSGRHALITYNSCFHFMVADTATWNGALNTSRHYVRNYKDEFGGWIVDADGVEYYVGGKVVPTVNTWYGIFGYEQSSNRASMRLYRAKFYKNGNLVLHLIPCVDYNHVLCLYDFVTGKFYYNAGSNSFSYGSMLRDAVDEADAQQVGPVLNNVLDVTESNDKGGYDIDVENILDDILGGAN